MDERFTVVWTSDVQDDFIAFWIGADSETRARLTDIANTIDNELKISPEAHGKLLPGESGLRVWRIANFDAPVDVVFEIRADDRLVRVLRISIG